MDVFFQAKRAKNVQMHNIFQEEVIIWCLTWLKTVTNTSDNAVDTLRKDVDA